MNRRMLLSVLLASMIIVLGWVIRYGCVSSSAATSDQDELAAIEADSPVSVSGSRQPAPRNAHFEPAAPRNDEVNPTGEATWPSRVDLALAAAADVGRESTASLPIRRASRSPWNSDDWFDLQAELEYLPDGI